MQVRNGEADASISLAPLFTNLAMPHTARPVHERSKYAIMGVSSLPNATDIRARLPVGQKRKDPPYAEFRPWLFANMTGLSGTSLPKPKDWQAFERSTRTLFQFLLDDPYTNLHGRTGQPQHGVDVWGTRKSNGKLVGVQCKLSNDDITERELKNELKKAQLFTPRLDEFILVTSAPRDAKIQKIARKLTSQLSKTSRPMLVAAWGWDDIEDRAATAPPQAWQAFDPTYTPFAEHARLDAQAADATTHDLITQVLQKLESANSAGATAIAADNDEQTPLHGQITALLGLAKSGNAQLSVEQLNSLRQSNWTTASPSERYRLLTALGVAHLNLGHDESAGRMLVDAYIEYPTHKNAGINRLKGLLLTRNATIALEFARKLHREQPGNAEIAGLLIQASADATSEPLPPLSEIPAALHETRDVQIAKIEFLRKRNNPEWITTAQTAAAGSSDIVLNALNAEGVLATVLEAAPDIHFGAPVSESMLANLNKAVDALRVLAADGSVASTFMVAAANNAALALRLLGRQEDAKTLLDLTIKKFPDFAPLQIQRAAIALREHEPKAALALLPQDNSNPEIVCLRVDCLIELKRDADALQLLDQTETLFAPPHVKLARTTARLSIYVEQDPAKAIAYVNEQLASAPNDLILQAVVVHTLRLAGHEQDAQIALDAALSTLHESSPYGARVQLAADAYSFRRYGDVLSLLRGRVSTLTASPGLELLCMAAVNGPFPSEARQLLNSLSPKVGALPVYLSCAVALAVKIGDPRSEQLIDEYLALRPGDLQIILRKCGNLILAGREKALQEYLSTIPLGSLQGSPAMTAQFANVLARYLDPMTGIRLGYETLMRNWENAAVHLAYHGAILLNPKLEGTLLPIDEIKNDCAIVVKEVDRPDKKYRIESASYPAFSDERLAPSSDLARILLGHKIGEDVTVTEGVAQRTLHIESVKHVYLDALHVSMEEFNVRFPKSDGLLSIKIDPAEPLKKFEDVSRARAEMMDQLLTRYEKQLLPLSFIAFLAGRSTLDAWSGLLQLDRKIITALGTRQERDQALAIIAKHNKTGFVVDAATALLVKKLDVKDPLEHVLGPLTMTKSVQDLFGARALDAQQSAKSQSGSLVWQDGRLKLQEYAPELLERLAAEAADDHQWMLTNVKVVPAAPKQDLEGDARGVVEMLPADVTDPAIAAEGHDLFLLSDDFGYRIWANTTFRIPTAWLQPALMVARDRGALSLTDYATAVSQLIVNGERHISLDGVTLREIAEAGAFTLSSRLQAALLMVGGPQADLITNIPILAAFLSSVQRKAHAHEFARMVSFACDIVAKGRGDAQNKLVRALYQGLATPPQWVTDLFIAWIRGHSFGSLYDANYR